MRFRPCIDIHNGKVKQIVGASLRDKGDMAAENFVSERPAADFAKLYQRYGLKGGHVILLNGKESGFYEETKKQAFSALAAYPGGLQAGGYNCKIPYKDIIYFYSDNKKINMVTADATIQFTGKLKELTGTIPGNFIQIHQSYIINMNHMNECSYELVKMNGGVELNISQPYRKQVRKQIMDYAWGQDS